METKVDFKTLEHLKKSLSMDIKTLEKRLTGRGAIDSAKINTSLLERGLKDVEQKITIRLQREISKVTEMVRQTQRGLSESKRLYDSQTHRRALASKSFSPMSQTSRSNRKIDNNARSSVKKQRSILNMSNEVSQLMMRSLSPSIQDNNNNAGGG